MEATKIAVSNDKKLIKNKGEMNMSLLERRKEVEREGELKEQRINANARQRVADSILKAFSEKELVHFVENKLVEHGRIWITGFGCLCQGGACISQKGFPELLKDFEKEWKDKGVRVGYGIDGVSLAIKGDIAKDNYRIKYDRKTKRRSVF